MMRVDSRSQGLADLHRHLDGSLRPETVAEFAATLGENVPSDLSFYSGMGLEQALSRFSFTLSLLQQPENVRRVASEICEDALKEGVTTLEIRFAPQLHRGAPMEAIVDAALEGISNRSGLLLCGLYGEDPSVLDRLVDIAASRQGVVGIDLAGGPTPSHRFHMTDYAHPFRRAKEHGLGVTVHAAEGRPPSEIRDAVEVLLADRIGHGTTLLEDSATVDLVLKQEVVIEACLSSNAHVGAIATASEHPLPKWLALGVRATVCTDNTLLSCVTSKSEHSLALTLPGMTDSLLNRAIAHGHEGRFR